IATLPLLLSSSSPTTPFPIPAEAYRSLPTLWMPAASPTMESSDRVPSLPGSMVLLLEANALNTGDTFSAVAYLHDARPAPQSADTGSGYVCANLADGKGERACRDGGKVALPPPCWCFPFTGRLSSSPVKAEYAHTRATHLSSVGSMRKGDAT
ncbi:unnamed protein product, partial [Pleuronectes platessa]